jgi:4-diphosphocytidyl-2-C-methyl-D-erythritol kinase
VKVTVPSLAKVNLDLRVLHKRPDSFHEVRTIYQTISLGDELSIEFRKQKRTQIDLSSSIDIADNLVIRAAKLVLEHLKLNAWVRFSLVKRIPMGAGLGGGSSNAASVLIALPALAGRSISFSEWLRLAENLGSDVPFFLHGGAALGFGRGIELYPLPDLPAHSALVVASGIHVSTPEAYALLGRTALTALTSQTESPILREFQTVACGLGIRNLDQLPLKNDFEKAVFGQHPELARLVSKLRRTGAKSALMTGSGSAVFGVFSDFSKARSAAAQFAAGAAFPVRFVSRRRYRQLWRRALETAAGASCFAAIDWKRGE